MSIIIGKFIETIGLCPDSIILLVRLVLVFEETGFNKNQDLSQEIVDMGRLNLMISICCSVSLSSHLRERDGSNSNHKER